jgi:hypothetical protein
MTKKRIGRPMKKPTPGTRAQLGLKVPWSLKEKIDAASIASGRSQSMECEARLERSFDHEWIVSEMKKLIARAA